MLLLRLIVCAILVGCATQCGPGRGSPSGRRSKKMTPLVFKQHVPNVSENTLGASGLAEGRITSNDAKFKNLVVNYNPDIIFKDDEGTGADRYMSQRCKDKLNALAVLVMNRWPGVKLRVTEGWDMSDGHHPIDSLHYEGRAVDVTTSDRDRAKYGMLARLAVEAGFDWVYFESRGHIHCSVKSDSSIAVRTGGCFPGSSTVRLEDGRVLSMSNLSVGDRVLAVDHQGALVYSEVIGFMHRDVTKPMTFQVLWTDDGRRTTLTGDHLIYSVPDNGSAVVPRREDDSPVYADSVRVGQFVFRPEPSENGNKRRERIITARVARLSRDVFDGVYAPLTSEGTIVVDDAVTSCYASLSSHALAHVAMAPFRAAYHVMGSRDRSSTPPPAGVHWYAEILLRFAKTILPDDTWYR